jgi:(E)-4-hydroxy-3-methylbut-2-enyl-diphosphate synthase
MPLWKTDYAGVETLKVAVMGCIVNGPGESKHADIGISHYRVPVSRARLHLFLLMAKKAHTLKRGDNIAGEFQAIVETYIQKRFGAQKSPKKSEAA